MNYTNMLLIITLVNVEKKMWIRLNLLMTNCIQFVMIQLRGGILIFAKINFSRDMDICQKIVSGQLSFTKNHQMWITSRNYLKKT